jgi:hypothetical protein
MPKEKLEGNWPHPARLPLGCGWKGHCTAPGHDGEVPSQDVLEAFCNLGYASGCSWAPSERDWDAVRLAVSAPERPTSENRRMGFGNKPARAIRLIYVCERDHRPRVHGELTFDLANATWLSKHDDPRVQKMAECFLESYLKKNA